LSDWKQRKKFTDQFTDDSYIVSNHCGFNVLYIISCGGNIGNFLLNSCRVLVQSLIEGEKYLKIYSNGCRNCLWQK
jgi:hypothetical protein